MSELEQLESSGKVFKLTGPVLLPTDTDDAKMTVQSRLDMISGEMKKVEEGITAKKKVQDALGQEVRARALRVLCVRFCSVSVFFSFSFLPRAARAPRPRASHPSTTAPDHEDAEQHEGGCGASGAGHDPGAGVMSAPPARACVAVGQNDGAAPPPPPGSLVRRKR